MDTAFPQPTIALTRRPQRPGDTLAASQTLRPAPVRPTSNKLERVIDILIRAKSPEGCPDAEKLAQCYECSSRTVKADIRFLRDRLYLPLDYDQLRRAYFLPPDSALPPFLTLESIEIFALFASCAHLQTAHPDLLEPIDSLIEKLESLFPQTIRHPLQRLEAISTPLDHGTPKVSLETLKPLFEACQRTQVVHFDYSHTLGEPPQQRQVLPRRLLLFRNTFYLQAWDLTKSAYRTFSTARISDISLTPKLLQPANLPPLPPAEEHFGIMKGPETHTVRIHFQGWAALYAAERTWHHAQILEYPTPDTLILQTTATDLREIANWILSFGQHALALTPPELRQLLANKITQIAHFYQNP